ncbi:MAG: TonB-dependent receptor, partial [Gemmatimonadaceae bacterium]|nr:TonB-dependent receptor [Gemmatimonadaceae bacterium]
AKRSYTLQATQGYAPGQTMTSQLAPSRVGGERIALVNDQRNLPELVRYVGSFQGISLNQGDQNLLAAQFRNAWTPGNGRVGTNSGYSASVGGNDPIFGHRVGYLASATYGFNTEVRGEQVRALADRGLQAGLTETIDRFTGTTVTNSVLLGGLANVSTMLGAGSRLSFNGVYNRTADNSARQETGAFENEGIDARINRLQYVERAVRSFQLAGEHNLGEANKIDWYVTSSGVSRFEPDRSEFVSALERDTPSGPLKSRWLNTGNGGAVRTFSDLDESSNEGRINLQRLFGQHTVKIGGLARRTDRDADTRAYSISAPRMTLAQRELSAEEIFDGRFSAPGQKLLQVVPLAQGGAYTAADRLVAGFAMTELALSERYRLITGARYEVDELTVDAVSTLGSPVSTTKRWADLLPSVALNVKLSEQQQLRFSASRTLARPEYRELSPIKSRDVLNGDDTEGNPNLERTNISNADIRWELYPNAGEVLSVGVFAKQFEKPIERVYRGAGSGTRTVFFTNADRATNYGLEIEARKSLAMFTERLRAFTAFTNLTVMRSEIDLSSSLQASATNLQRAMVGQAPTVINAGLTWSATGNGASATLLYNRIGDRVFAAGDRPLPDVIERARDGLDLSVRFPVFTGLNLRVDARNLLDAPTQMTQGTVVREYWRTGRTFVMGFQWRP